MRYFVKKEVKNLSHNYTEVIKIDPNRPEESRIERAVALLRAGEIIVFPTETVYGLGADAFQTGAIERIFAAKGRPFNDPLIVHIADEDALNLLVTHIPDSAKQLALAFWPGPLTMILPRRSQVPTLVTAGLETVAVRMPRHSVALALIHALGSPIAAPSANRFMHISPTTAQHALADLDGRVSLILDGGPCEVGVESTVLDLCSDVPRILRPGGVSLEALQRVLPHVEPPKARSITGNEPSSTDNPDEEAQRSPGQLLLHYAPTVPLLLFEGRGEPMLRAMLAEVQRRCGQGERVGVLVADEDITVFEGSGALVHTLGNAADPAQVAAALFSGLRAIESTGVQVVLCRSFDTYGLGLAIHDRLLRAAGGKVFKRS